MSGFHDRVLVKQVNDANPDRPPLEPADLVHASVNTYGAMWEAANPDDRLWTGAERACCMGAAVYGPARCDCWEPVFDVDQVHPAGGPVIVAPRMCGDCAYRADSPERSDVDSAAVLLDLPALGDPFYCHTGMRRPVLYRHPTLGDLPANSGDWQPAILGGVPARADGSPAMLCAGWAARVARLEA